MINTEREGSTEEFHFSIGNPFLALDNCIPFHSTRCVSVLAAQYANQVARPLTYFMFYQLSHILAQDTSQDVL